MNVVVFHNCRNFSCKVRIHPKWYRILGSFYLCCGNLKRNDLLRFRFRIQSRTGSRPYLAQFFKITKLCTKFCLLSVKSIIVSLKVVISFLKILLWPLFSILCWIRIQIQIRNWNAFRSGFAKAKAFPAVSVSQHCFYSTQCLQIRKNQERII